MKILAVILAGGKRQELMPLVEDRCKAAVPFFGKYRVIDFVLSNCLNSEIRRVNVIVQHKFNSLQKHIRDGWSIYASTIGEYIDVYPPQQRHGESWYMGSADAVFQNIFAIEQENPEYVLIVSGEHIYRMDYRELIQQHIKNKADLTIATIPIPVSKSIDFGIMKFDQDYRVNYFVEKPQDYKDKSDKCWASMGMYIFSTDVLKKFFRQTESPKKSLDFGKDIIPAMISEYKVFAYPFVDDEGKARYWNFLRGMQEYYEGNMDLLYGRCEVHLYDSSWPYRTFQSQSPPTRTFSSENLIVHSAISSRGLIEGKVINSILGTNVTVENGAEVRDSILFDNVHIKRGAKLSKTIIDKGTIVPADWLLSAENHSGWSECTVTDGNIVVLGKKAAYIK